MFKYYLAKYSENAKFIICENEGKRYFTSLLYVKQVKWHFDAKNDFSPNTRVFKSESVSEKWLRLNGYPIYNPSISYEAY